MYKMSLTRKIAIAEKQQKKYTEMQEFINRTR